MPDPLQTFLIAERRKRVTPSEVRRALGRKAPNLKVVENRYNAALQRVQVRINRQVREAIQPLIAETLRQDAFDPVDDLFDALAKGVLNIINSALMINIFDSAADATQAVNFRKYDTKLYNTIGINNVSATATDEMITNWIRRNTQLITNVNAKQLASLQGLFRDSAFTQVRASELQGAISKIFRGTRSNVKLIALDQVQKLNGQLDQMKQQDAGVEGYYWRTSRDERVRASHAAREGNFYTWDSPPPGGQHPGQEVMCRCDAEPAVDKLLFSGKELREEQARLRVENAELKRQAIARSAKGPLKPPKRARPRPTPRPAARRVPLARPRPAPRKPPTRARKPERRTQATLPRTGQTIDLTKRQQIVDQNARFIGSNERRFIAANQQEQASSLQWNWVHGSNRKVSVWMKEAAKREFNLGGIIHNPKGFAVPKGVLGGSRKTLRAIYENTQKELRKVGLKKVTVYRGVRGNTITPGVLESWTTDIDIARKFGDNVIVKEVPASKILNYYKSRNWVNGIWGNQREFLIME
jgi:SPP1 gp7 family putative phage head morphogenesis protein